MDINWMKYILTSSTFKVLICTWTNTFFLTNNFEYNLGKISYQNVSTMLAMGVNNRCSYEMLNGIQNGTSLKYKMLQLSLVASNNSSTSIGSLLKLVLSLSKGFIFGSMSSCEELYSSWWHDPKTKVVCQKIQIRGWMGAN